MGSFFNNIKAVGDQFFNHGTDATKPPANVLSSGAYSNQAPTLAAAQAGYPTASVSGPGAQLLTGGGQGTLSGMFNNLANMSLASGGTNYYNAPTPSAAMVPAAQGAAATATPQSYIQAAGRTMAPQPQAQGANLNTNTWSG
jgi:hypothetical protein